MIYLDNAATTGRKPPGVQEAVARALRGVTANPGRSGHQASLQAATLVYRCREALSRFFDADAPEQVAFTQNCTHSINCVLKGLLQAGDHVVVSSLEHNAVMRPLEALRRERGVVCDVAEVIFGDPDATFRAFERLIRPETKLVFCTHASNVTGECLPIARIGALCAAQGVPFGVDAAQTAGILPISMRKMQIDFLCVAPHKGLYAPMGVGVLIARKPLPHTLLEGGTGTDSVNFLQPSSPPERFESGTVNLPGIAGLAAGLEFVRQKGIEKICRHEIALLARFYDGLRALPGVRLYGERPTFGRTAPVLSFNLRQDASMQVGAYLDAHGVAVRAGLHCAPAAHARLGTIDSGTVRVCPSVYNRAEETERVLFLLKKY